MLQSVINLCSILVFLGQRMNECCSTDIDRTAEQRSSLYGPADDAVEVRGRLLQLVHLRHTSCEVLKALRRAPA